MYREGERHIEPRRPEGVITSWCQLRATVGRSPGATRQLFWPQLCRPSTLLLTAFAFGFSPPTLADGGVAFTDIATVPDSGIHFERTPSPRIANADAIRAQGLVALDDFLNWPIKAHGNPGVALLDFDRDGDLDIYVANGPGTANSLYSNQLVDTGNLFFEDVALGAGVAATAQDSQGICFGDTDNDDDLDLYVLGAAEPNLFFENNGDGTFTDVTHLSEVGEGTHNSFECTMGDVDGDGLLDIYVGNTYRNPEVQIGVLAEPYAFNEHNTLLMNHGDNLFIDESDARGVREIQAHPPGTADATLMVAMADLDHDGDMDILIGSDQGGIPGADFGGVDRGLIHPFINDGNGFFTDRMFEAGTDKIGGWMGVALADFDCNGTLDFFASNFGQYARQVLPTPALRNEFDSRWFLNNGDGTFADPGVGSLGATPFGWGAATADYDNDGDQDIIFHGGLDLGLAIEATNPGSILTNQGCGGNFTLDTMALAGSTNHSARGVQGVAVGDLDQNGFVDIISVANWTVPEQTLVPLAPENAAWDGKAFFVPTFAPTQDPVTFAFTGIVPQNGNLSVELNDGANGNRWIEVHTRGSIGTTDLGAVNRDGIGAQVSVTPRRGVTTMRPVVGGGSFSSQDALALGFGLGDARWARVDVVWPGNVRNRLHRVKAGSRLVFPEIPCSIDGDWDSFQDYKTCVGQSLADLVAADVLSPRQAIRFKISAILGFFGF